MLRKRRESVTRRDEQRGRSSYGKQEAMTAVRAATRARTNNARNKAAASHTPAVTAPDVSKQTPSDTHQLPRYNLSIQIQPAKCKNQYPKPTLRLYLNGSADYKNKHKQKRLRNKRQS